MNDPTPPLRQCLIPVYGAWSHRSSAELTEEWEAYVTTPETVTVRHDEYYGFGFHAVGDVTDADVGRLAAVVRGVPTFQSLDLSGCEQVTDRGFTAFADANHIEHLKLIGCGGMTSDVFKTVSTMRGLRELEVEGFGRYADRALAFLTDLPRLRYLGVQACPVTDASLVHVANMPALETISLGGCQAVTDRGLAQLGKNPSLRRVVLSGCWRITDRGLAHLAGLPNLEYVMLPVPGSFWSRVSGRFAHMMSKDRDVPNPKGLYSPAGVRKLQAARPKCEVDQMFDYQSLGDG